MAITSIKTGSSFTNLQKYDSFLAGNTAFSPSSYESISTVTVGSGGSSSIDFTSIPSTYTHLQIRCIMKMSSTIQDVGNLYIQLNGDTAANYSAHRVYGNGTSVSAQGLENMSQFYWSQSMPSAYSGYASMFGAAVIDILDYANTNKYKTGRALIGQDTNSSSDSQIKLASANWRSTSAVTSIKIFTSPDFAQYSQFALYGIK